jgi:Zn-dependent protease
MHPGEGKSLKRNICWIAFASSLLVIVALAPSFVDAASVKIQLSLVVDGSGSVSATEWNLIRQAIAKAINETIPRDGSVELSIVQFGYSPAESYAITELKPTIIDGSNFNATAALVLTMPKASGSTPTSHGLYLGWTEIKNSSSFSVSTRKVINLATDGVPNVRNGNATTDLDGNGGSPNANDDVVATVNAAVSEGLNELDIEAIGMTESNNNWLKDHIVYPQPGVEAPPFTKPGWIRIVANPSEFASTIGQKIGIIVHGEDESWAPSAEGALAAGLVTVGLTGAVSAIGSAVANPDAFPGNAIAKKIADFLPDIVKKWMHEFISSRRKTPIAKKTGSLFRLTKIEIISYALALLILTLAFGYAKSQSINEILLVLPTILATSIVVGFVKSFLEEIVARKLGVWTEHRLWYFGLAAFVLSTLIFRAPFSSPSRNVSYSKEFTKRSLGLASASSVFIGLGFAGIFYLILVNGFALVGSIGIVMSLTIAFFEALPIPPMNGKDIYNWCKPLWIALFEVTFSLYLLCLLVM